MQKKLSAALLMMAVLPAAGVFSHPATELYIPIGQSPGISNVKSYVGRIRSLRETDDGFLMNVEGSVSRIDVDESTKIYVDAGPGKKNRVGTRADCEVGRTVEVYLHESGVAYWVKVRER